MKRNRNSSRKRRQEELQVWKLEEARRAVPYIASILQTLRETRLASIHAENALRRLDAQPGRPGRLALIARQEALADSTRADTRFHESLEELHAIDVYCLDPIQGLALIPFVHEDQLAWLVFDLFDQAPLRFWRFHQDPLETRRPIAQVTGARSDSDSVIV